MRMLGLVAISMLVTASVARPDTLPTEYAKLEAAVVRGDLGEVTSVVVEQRGTIVYERYFGNSGADALHDIRSAGKSITALAVGAAIADGKLPGTEVRVWPALGAAADDPRNEITLQDLLTMSSALDCNDWDERSPGNEERMYPRQVWRDFAMSIPLADGYAREPAGLGRFSYCTAGVFLIGQLVGDAVGMSFDRYVSTRIFAPLGINKVDWKRSPTGEVQSGGQLRMRSADLAKLGRLLLDRGASDGREIVPATWIERMLTPYRRATPTDDYGYLWWLRAFRDGERAFTGWYMSGNGGTKVVLLPALDAVVVVTATNYNQPMMHQISTDIVERIVLPALRGSAS